VFSLGTPPVSVDDLVTLIRRLRPSAAITHRETPLPFPEGADDAALRARLPVVYETPLSEGVSRTILAFEERLADGRLSPPQRPA
jgi:hypothetical protein